MKQRKNGHRSIVSAASLLSLTALAVATSVVSCAEEDLVNSIPMSNVLTFQVKVNDAVETKTRSGIDNTLDGFFPTSSLELRSDDNTIFYANCEERNGIHMHYDTSNTKTRGTVVNNNNFYDSFLLYGYTYGSEETFTPSTAVNSSINGVSVSKGSGTTWQPTGVTWPGADKKATFYAIAPNNSGATVSTDDGGPTFTYTVPQSASDQKDLLVSKCENVSCDGKSAPTLTFNHALAAIKFAKGNIAPYTSITKVEITGVYSDGRYSMYNDSWNAQSSKDNYSISSTDDVLFLMPQTLPSGAQLKVTLSDGSTTKVLTSDLSGNWQNGNQYTYKLSYEKITGTFHFDVIPSSTETITKDGTGEVSFTVSSYFEYSDNGTTKKVAIPWSAGSNATLKGEGGETVSSVTITTKSMSHQDALLCNLNDDENKPIDLSQFSDGQSTANCYVVQGCGWYKLPLVYGNGIKKGQSAKDANGEFGYNNSANYMNHAGTAISSLSNAPYIYNNGYDLGANGQIVWESITGLIKSGSVQLCDDGKYLKFYVDPANVNQGNAVIAVKTTDDKIAWSWHIWVTDQDWESTYTYTHTNGTVYNFMKMPVGFVDDTTSPTLSSPRTFIFKFKQNISGGASNTVKISQEGDASRSGTCTFYQWGRKDPFKAENQSSPGTSQVAQSAAIQNPGKFIAYSRGNWSTDQGYDYWCVGNTSTGTSAQTITVKKSIYDPSPVGYCVPPTAAHVALNMGQSGFVYDNNNGFSNSANGDYWQLFGYIDRSTGSMGNAGGRGYFWSASPDNSSSAYSLSCYDDGDVSPQNFRYRSLGYTVRPVSE